MLREGRHQSLMGGMALQALTVAPGHASGAVGDSLGDSLKTAQTPPYLTRCYGFKDGFISQHAATAAFGPLIGEKGGALPPSVDSAISEVQVGSFGDPHCAMVFGD